MVRAARYDAFRGKSRRRRSSSIGELAAARSTIRSVVTARRRERARIVRRPKKNRRGRGQVPTEEHARQEGPTRRPARRCRLRARRGARFVKPARRGRGSAMRVHDGMAMIDRDPTGESPLQPALSGRRRDCGRSWLSGATRRQRADGCRRPGRRSRPSAARHQGAGVARSSALRPRRLRCVGHERCPRAGRRPAVASAPGVRRRPPAGLGEKSIRPIRRCGAGESG